MRRLLSTLLAVACLSSCGLAPRTFDDAAPARVSVTAAAAPSALIPARTSPRAAALRQLTPAQRRAFHRLMVHLAFARWLKGLAYARMSSPPWPCIAIAETGGSPAMGPTYWTEYGVVIDIIEDFGTPTERAAIFGGYADALTRWRPVNRFAAVHGYGGWGTLTKQKCGL